MRFSHKKRTPSRGSDRRFVSAAVAAASDADSHAFLSSLPRKQGDFTLRTKCLPPFLALTQKSESTPAMNQPGGSQWDIDETLERPLLLTLAPDLRNFDIRCTERLFSPSLP